VGVDWIDKKKNGIGEPELDEKKVKHGKVPNLKREVRG